MTILSLQLSEFRNLRDCRISLSNAFNVVCGPNGSGKTSLLEALYLFTSGRSFRTRKLDSLVCRELEDTQSKFVLFGQISREGGASGFVGSPVNVGIQKIKQENATIRIDGSTISSAAELALLCPVLILEPGNLSLLTGVSQARRKFLDWSVFHVEHSFAKIWKSYRYCLKQRNALLRQHKHSHQSVLIKELLPWDEQLVALAKEIDSLRITQVKVLEQNFKEISRSLLEGLDIQLSYRPGWDKKKGFREHLSDTTVSDQQKGYTSVGPHRMDVRITAWNKPAIDVLSRGQLKLVSLAMFLSQIRTLRSLNGKKSVVLLDDVAAELDAQNIAKVISELHSLESQVICTSLDDHQIKNIIGNQYLYKMFHVEHGLLTEENKQA